MIFREEKPLSADVLICAKGGGGLLRERMKLAAQLWEAGIKVRGYGPEDSSCILLTFDCDLRSKCQQADYVGTRAPSLTEQYEEAHERGVKWLVIISDQYLKSESVKVSFCTVR